MHTTRQGSAAVPSLRGAGPRPKPGNTPRRRAHPKTASKVMPRVLLGTERANEAQQHSSPTEASKNGGQHHTTCDIGEFACQRSTSVPRTTALRTRRGRRSQIEGAASSAWYSVAWRRRAEFRASSRAAETCQTQSWKCEPRERRATVLTARGRSLDAPTLNAAARLTIFRPTPPTCSRTIERAHTQQISLASKCVKRN